MVRGRITKLVNFGAFARLVDTGIEGLIHISELSDRRVNSSEGSGQPRATCTTCASSASKATSAAWA